MKRLLSVFLLAPTLCAGADRMLLLGGGRLGPTGPVPYISDNFTGVGHWPTQVDVRVSNGLGHTGVFGGAGKSWVIFYSTTKPFGISDVVIGYPSGYTGSFGGGTYDCGDADVAVVNNKYPCIPPDPGRMGGSVLIRWTDVNNHIRGGAINSQANITKRVGGTDTALLHISASLARPMKVVVTASGATVKLYVGGVLIGTPVSISDFLAVTSHGFCDWANNPLVCYTDDCVVWKVADYDPTTP